MVSRTLQAIIDSFPAHVTLVDASGVLRAVNRAWVEYSRESGARPETVQVGADYFAACRRAGGGDRVYAVAAERGLRMVLSGQREEFRLEYPCPAPDRERWFELSARPLRVLGKSGAMVCHYDVTARVLAERSARQTEAALSRMWVHRVNNTLAFILAVATATARHSSSLDAFRRDFSGRMQATAVALRLLADVQGHNVRLETLVNAVVALTAREHGFSASGPDLLIGGRVATAVALMVHELATHARRFGAWTHAEGRVAIHWDLSKAASPEVTLTWREIGGGHSPDATQLEGYGLHLLQMLLPQQLGGTAAMRVERDGLVYELRVPAEDGVIHGRSSGARTR